MRLQLLLCTTILMLGVPVYTMNEQEFNQALASVHQLQKQALLAQADESVQQILTANSTTLSDEQKRTLEFELERSRRIRRDYSKTEEQVKDTLQRRLAEGVYSDAAFEEWKAEGYFDFKSVDGDELLYLGSSVPNFFHRHETIKPKDFKAEPTKWELFLLDEAKRVVAEVENSHESMAIPRDFEMWMRINVKPGVVKEGVPIRVWMPFPQDFKYQTQVNFLESLPVVNSISPQDYPHRSLYFEAPAGPQDLPNKFFARWEMRRFPQHTNIVAAEVPEKQNVDLAMEFLGEKPPHVVFTPEMIALEKEIAGNLTNPADKARAYYDWISHNIKYSYAHEYSTLHNISDFVRRNGYGDCGQISLLYITLCRIGGIPARWSTGWVIYPMYTGLHDWSEIYLEPYGWVHVDANWGIFIERDFYGVSREDKDFLKDFYFGGMDAYRFTANRDHGYAHTPEKTDFRSDTVDFQRGELEAGGKNIYFNDFSFKLNVQYLEGHNKADGAFD
ncbi:MAG: transglutaminase family protein [Sumerlaeia bacterium]